jgi:AbiV family abortive infection protein
MMAAKRLPDEYEAAEGAALAVANAVDLLGDADLLADAELYSGAVSLVVLAFEESVKARTIGGHYGRRSGAQPGLQRRHAPEDHYSGHQIRHDAGLLQHVAATSRTSAASPCSESPYPPAKQPRCRNWLIL